ncbi:pilin [Hamadaea sp. NPDC050747]|uniref:pilin n=1 Tax=Hamadaea sp. NPDC050747 TaxID=3155789 RepID=UPI0033F2DE96
MHTIHFLLSAADPDAGTKALTAIIENARGWVVGILAAVATLFLVVAGLRHVTAGGDPAEVEKAKDAFKNALKGYALAALAPIVMQILIGLLP